MRWFVLLLLLVVSSSFAFSPPLTNIKVKVVDESGVPVSDVRVGATYYGATDFDSDVELTDEEGIATVSGRSVYAVPFSVSKPGYYPGGKKVMPWEAVNGKEVFRDREVTIMLREKRNPIPLYAIKYSGEIPVAEEWVGFDLQKADWVSPYGNGVVPDFLFWYEGSVESFLNAEGVLKVRFSSPDDGLREIESLTTFSRMLVPHEAPKSGYAGGDKIFLFKVTGEPPILKGGSAYYFARLRSERDSKGDLIESHYAKIYEGISFDPRMKEGESGVAWVGFTYYFNPVPNDRNLEFDTSRNLFNELSFDERVKNP